jgi:hypothetical protein
MTNLVLNVEARRASEGPRSRFGLLSRAKWAAIVMAALAAAIVSQSKVSAAQADGSTAESRRDWEFYSEVKLPDADDSPWCDFVLGPSVFDKSGLDLGDLRLYDAAGREVPYALRVRRTQAERQAIAAREFNRTPGPDGSREVSLDLGDNPPPHNEIELVTPGTRFRRPVQVEGSADNNEWRVLIERAYLLRFDHGKDSLNVRRLGYADSRFRYLRVRVFPDPEVDREPVELADVKAFRTVDVPGETFSVPATVGAREDVMGDGGPGSAWILDLGATNVPCETLRVHVGDTEFVRNYRVESLGPVGTVRRFNPSISNGEWSRRAGEPLAPLEAKFGEQPITRFRLIVTDNRNQPVTIDRAEAVGSARQIVFARSGVQSPVRLYFGNPRAEPPNYDFARQLPARLDPAPARLTHADRQVNPDYVPPPKPLTERWPWLIYVVLSAAALVLTGLLVQLARTAIAEHDARLASPETAI